MKIYDKSIFLRALSILVLCISEISNSNYGAEASHKTYPRHQNLPATKIGDQVHRTGYHFQPHKHWINDPNGPMYFNGHYHLFYQYNPNGSVWGNIVWAHSVSRDLVNWIGLEPAIFPSKPFDQYGCWSGSTTILPGNRPVILYTGLIDTNQTQVQNYAIPANISDPYLRKWVKPDENPIIVATKGVNKTAFRDPTTAWVHPDGTYRILIGGRHKETGIAHLYKSKDFKKWVKPDHDLHSVDNVGNWECPDFYRITTNGSDPGSDPNAKHVLKISLDEVRFDYYTVGTYYPEKDIYVPDKSSADNWNGLRMDYGSFYASKSFFDSSKNRRVVWGWANESDQHEDDTKKGWAGILLVPRTIRLDLNRKQLLQWPIEELNGLRGGRVGLSNRAMKKGERVQVAGITAAQADVEVTFSFSNLDSAEAFDPRWRNLDGHAVCRERGSFVAGGLGPFGLLTLATHDLQEYTPVFFRVFKDDHNYKVLLCSDARRASLNKNVSTPSYAGFIDVDLTVDKKLSLRSLIDHSVVEAFGEGGKVCVSSRVYPSRAIAEKAHLYAFNNGTEAVTIETLNAWSLSNATITFPK